MKFSAVLFLAAILSCASAAQGNSHACIAPHYKIIPLPLLPVRINDSEVVIGTTARADEEHQAALWTEKDGLRVIDLPAGFTAAEPKSINAKGEIVGTAWQEASKHSAFRYFQGALSLLPEHQATAMAINNAGAFAGQVAEHLTLWDDGKATQLGDCCGGIVHSINANKQVVGQVNDKEGHYSAFLWDRIHSIQPVAAPHSANSTALSINGHGHVLLQSFTPNTIYVVRDGKPSPVKLSPEFASQPLSMNDCDVIVGEFGPASDFNHAFIWDSKSGFRDLNKLADTGAEWTLETALDINNRGEIVGIGDRGGQQDVGFLLVPDARSTKSSATRK